MRRVERSRRPDGTPCGRAFLSAPPGGGVLGEGPVYAGAPLLGEPAVALHDALSEHEQDVMRRGPADVAETGNRRRLREERLELGFGQPPVSGGDEIERLDRAAAET